MQNSTPQGSHMYVLTVQSGQRAACTITGAFTPPPGATRYDVLAQLRIDAARQYPALEGGVVTFFSLEPNTL
ncbi:hypothetical protein [Streptomyces sp. NPDC056480]|uniref:hypothetical protein n=1 Tax=Streptomyces sp. NPDC056480 TaxID=3345833 RepID=UPI003686B918